jgi:hypothetical protein
MWMVKRRRKNKCEEELPVVAKGLQGRPQNPRLVKDIRFYGVGGQIFQLGQVSFQGRRFNQYNDRHLPPVECESRRRGLAFGVGGF